MFIKLMRGVFCCLIVAVLWLLGQEVWQYIQIKLYFDKHKDHFLTYDNYGQIIGLCLQGPITYSDSRYLNKMTHLQLLNNLQILYIDSDSVPEEHASLIPAIRNLRLVTIYGRKQKKVICISEHLFKNILQSPRITSISISNNTIPNRFWDQISRYPKLESLELVSVGLTDEILYNFNTENLIYLDVSKNFISDDMVHSLAKSKKLETFIINETLIEK